MVVAGARLDMSEPDGALVALDAPVVRRARGEVAERVALVRADALEALGRVGEAHELRASVGLDDELVVVDLEEDEAGEGPPDDGTVAE